MFFKRIEMHGFKSFAEPVTIEFDRGITCIVGPNGSGKSNISDAIRWVLGEQSPKMLRGGRMEDVIFAGTSNRKSRGMAEVTLVIDNEDGKLPIEYNEVAITRRMYRSGESEYAINNNRCRMRDIKDILVDTGIGVDGYSLIGQGKISDIISNKTESIREIFEETAGVVSYRTKKAEAERRLASSNINMDRVNDIIEEIESRIDGLREDSEKAAEYLELRDRNRELEINITIDSIENIKEKIRIYKEDISVLSGESEEADKKKKQVEEELMTLAESLLEISTVQGEKKERLDNVNREMGRAFGDVRVSREKLNSIKRDIDRLHREISDFRLKLESEEEEHEKLMKEKETLDVKLKDSEEKLREELKTHGNVKSERELKAGEISRKKEELFSMSGDLSVMSGEKNSFKNLLENLEKTEKEAKVNFQIYEENIAETESLLDGEKKKRENLLKEQGEIKLKLNENISEEVSLKKQITDTERGLKEKELRKSEILSRKRTIQEMEANYEGYNGGVRFVMKKNIKGIRGTVGELGVPAEGFEVALETAVGGQIQNIICDDEYSAKKAIEELKRARAGRVTFLPADSVSGRVRRDRAIEGRAGFSGYAVDCIDFDEKYRGIFEYLLGNTVVLENMDYAIEISGEFGRAFRCVTLEGEIVNTSGAVTGGKYKNKTANLFERKSEIIKLEKELDELGRRKDEEERELETLKKQWNRAEEERRNLEIKERETGNELTRGGAAIASLEDKREADRRAFKTWKDSSDNAQVEKEKLHEKIKNIDIRIQEKENEMKAQEESIIKMTDEFEAMESSIKNADEVLSEVREEVNRYRNEYVNLNNLIDFAGKNAGSLQEDIKRREKQIENLNCDAEGINRGIDIHDRIAAEKKIEKEKLEAEVRELDGEKMSADENVKKLTVRKDEIYRNLDRVKGQKYEIDVKLARQEGQLDSLKNKLWEDFQVSYAQALTMKKDDFVVSSATRENREIKSRIRELGEVNVGAIKEYAKVNERYTFMTAQREDIEKSTEELRTVIEDLDKIIRVKFRAGFDSVAKYFEEIFVEFFGGGHARITLEDENDPLNSGIEITAQPPGKQLRNINLMSGGEKTMTAIALMFAVVKTKPTPCCILDEVEAALDDHNIHVFANYLRNFEDIQFTLITHQKTTMEHADVMYGVTMPEKGVSKVFSLKMDGSYNEN